MENPWKILGKSIDKSRVFGNPDFGKKSRCENKLAVFVKFLKFVAKRSKVVALTFRCGSRYGVPELISWRSAENIDFLLDQIQY